MNAESANVTRDLTNCAEAAHTSKSVASKGTDKAVDSNKPQSGAIEMATPTAPTDAPSLKLPEEKTRFVRKVTFIDPAKLKAMGLDVQIANALKKQRQDALPPVMQQIIPQVPHAVAQPLSSTKLATPFLVPKAAKTSHKDAKQTRKGAKPTKIERKPTKKDPNPTKKDSKPKTKADPPTNQTQPKAIKVTSVAREAASPASFQNISSESRVSLPVAAELVPSSLSAASRQSVEPAPTQLVKILEPGVVLKPMIAKPVDSEIKYPPIVSTNLLRDDLTPVKAILNQFLLQKATRSLTVSPNSSAPEKQARVPVTAKKKLNSNKPASQQRSQAPTSATSNKTIVPPPPSVFVPLKTHEASFKNFIISQHINQQRSPLPVTPPPLPNYPTAKSSKNPLKTFVISKERKQVNMALNPVETMAKAVQSRLSPVTPTAQQPVAKSHTITSQDPCPPMASAKDSEKAIHSQLPLSLVNANSSPKNRTVKIVTYPRIKSVPLREFLVKSAIPAPDTKVLLKEGNNNIDTVTEENPAKKIQPIKLARSFSNEALLNEATRMVSPLPNKRDQDKHSVAPPSNSSNTRPSCVPPMQHANIFDNEAHVTEQRITTARARPDPKQSMTPVKILENKVLSYGEKINISGLFSAERTALNNPLGKPEVSNDLEPSLENHDEEMPSTPVKPLALGSVSNPNTEQNLDIHLKKPRDTTGPISQAIKGAGLENRDEQVPAAPVKPIELRSVSNSNMKQHLDIHQKKPEDTTDPIAQVIRGAGLENRDEEVPASTIKPIELESVSKLGSNTQQKLYIKLKPPSDSTAPATTRKAYSAQPGASWKKAPLKKSICSQQYQIEALKQLEKLMTVPRTRKSSKTVSGKIAGTPVGPTVPKDPTAQTSSIIQSNLNSEADSKEEEASDTDLSAVDFVYSLSLKCNAAPSIELTPEESRLTELVRKNSLQRKQRKRPHTETQSVYKNEEELPECSTSIRRRLNLDKKSEVEEKSSHKGNTERQDDVEMLNAILKAGDGDCVRHIVQQENLSQRTKSNDAVEDGAGADITDLVTSFQTTSTERKEAEPGSLKPFVEKTSKSSLGAKSLETNLPEERDADNQSNMCLSGGVGNSEQISQETRTVTRTISVIQNMHKLRTHCVETPQSQLRDTTFDLTKNNATTVLRNMVRTADQQEEQENPIENLSKIEVHQNRKVGGKYRAISRNEPTAGPGVLSKKINNDAVVLENTIIAKKDTQQENIVEYTPNKTEAIKPTIKPEGGSGIGQSDVNAAYEDIFTDDGIVQPHTQPIEAELEKRVPQKMSMAETISRSQVVIVYEDPSIPQTIVPFSPMKGDVEITNATDKNILILQTQRGAVDGDNAIGGRGVTTKLKDIPIITSEEAAAYEGIPTDGVVIDSVKSFYSPRKNYDETVIPKEAALIEEDTPIIRFQQGIHEGVLINNTGFSFQKGTDTGLNECMNPMVSDGNYKMRADKNEDTSKPKKVLQNPVKQCVESTCSKIGLVEHSDEIPKLKRKIAKAGNIITESEHMSYGHHLRECTADAEPSTSKRNNSITRQHTPQQLKVVRTENTDSDRKPPPQIQVHAAVEIPKQIETICSSPIRTERKRLRKIRELKRKFDDSSSESDGFPGFEDSPNTSGRLRRGFESIETCIAGRNNNRLKISLASRRRSRICRQQGGITPIKKHSFNHQMPFKKRWELAESSVTDDTSQDDDYESDLGTHIGAVNVNLKQNEKNHDKEPVSSKEEPGPRTLVGTESKRIAPTTAEYCDNRLGSSKHLPRNIEKNCDPQTKNLLRISGEESESNDDGSIAPNASHKSSSGDETSDSIQLKKVASRKKKFRCTAGRKRFRILDSDEQSGGGPNTQPEIYNNESNDSFDDFSDTGELLHTEPDQSEEEASVEHQNLPLTGMEYTGISGERTETEKLPYKGKKRGRKPKNVISAADCQERFQNYTAIKSEEGAASTTIYGLNAPTETGRLPYSGKKRGPKPKDKSAIIESAAVKLEKGQIHSHNESTGGSDADSTSSQKLHTGRKRGRPPKSYYQILNDGELEDDVRTGEDVVELSPAEKRSRRKLQPNFSYDESEVESDVHAFSAAPKSYPNKKSLPVTKGKRGRKPKLQLVDQSCSSIATAADDSFDVANTSMLSESSKSTEDAQFKMPKSNNFPYNKELETHLTVNIAWSIAERIKHGRKLLSSEMNSTFDPRLLLVRQRSQIETEENLQVENSSSGPWQCGLCSSSTTPSEWMSHLAEHYGVGWVYGRDTVPNLFNRSVVLATISNYFKKMGKVGLTCRMCKRSYRSALGLLLHIEMCGSSDTRVPCEYCKKDYSRLTLSGHIRICPDRLRQNRDYTDNAACSSTANANTEMYSNSGRVKRVSLIKAEKKLKAIEEDSHLDIDLKQYFQIFWPSMIEFYDQWNKELKSDGKSYCPKDDCNFAADNLAVMESHLKSKLNPRYRCLLCKDQQILDSDKEALKHFIVQHKSSADDFANNHSDCSLKLEDETTTDDAFHSSSDDRDENIDTAEEKTDEPMEPKRKRTPGRPQSNESKRLCSRRVNGSIADFVNTNWNRFVNENYSSTFLFPYALPQYRENKMSDTCAPQATTSMKFSLSKTQDLVGTFGKMKTTGEWSHLNLYEAAEEQNGVLIYLGSPVKVLAWAPLPPDTPHQYLAVTCRKDIFKHTRQANPEISPTLVYFFQTATQISAGSNKTALLYALRISDGPVHCLAFLPSGGYSSNNNRLGLLAVGTASRDIKIYALPLKVVRQEGSDKRLNVIDLKPTMVLALDPNLRPHDMPRAQCLRLCWSETNGHRHVSAAFSNGFLGIWDISGDEADNLNCSLLDGVRNFSPLNYFFIGEKRITGLCMHYDTEGPRWIAASSAARKVVIYDIKNISQPLLLKASLPKNIVSSIDWSPIWEQLVATYGDIGPLNGCCAGGISPLNLVFSNNKIDQMICTCTHAHYNPVDNLIVCSSDNGELVFLNPSDTHFDDLHNSHVNNMARAYVLTDIKSLTGQPLEDCKISQDGTISGGKLYEEDYKKKYGLVLGAIKKYSTDQKQKYLAKTRVPPRNLLQFMRINWVRWNLNFGASDKVAAGYENGLIRILSFNKNTYFK